MPEFSTNLGDGFHVVIAYTVDGDGQGDDLSVRSSATGQVLDDLIFGSSLWDEAARKADAHAGISPAYLRSVARDAAAACHDTPYA